MNVTEPPLFAKPPAPVIEIFPEKVILPVGATNVPAVIVKLVIAIDPVGFGNVSVPPETVTLPAKENGVKLLISIVMPVEIPIPE